MKKLLILGAMEMHVPLIKRAKELGIYTITCDYLPENPGHKISDEAYFDSTTDLEAVLKLAEKLKVDGVMTYNSDPAAQTAAYVSEKLGLPGNPYKSVKIMSEKNLFRDFLLANKLNVPKFGHFTDAEDVERNITQFTLPVIIKPVDSSGSKGVTVIYDKKDIKDAVTSALEKSRCKKFIVEEYIEPEGRQLHGDGFVENGKLTFLCLGDHHFDTKINNLVPYSTTFPTEHSDVIVNRCKEQIQSFITAVGFKNGGFNVELRVSKKDGKPYIIDIGARNGGNFTPKVIEYATGFNFMDRALKLSVGESISDVISSNTTFGYVSYLIMHSSINGLFNGYNLLPELENRVIEKHIYVKPGDKVESFLGANAAIGVLIMKYESRAVMNKIVDSFADLYTVDIQQVD